MAVVDEREPLISVIMTVRDGARYLAQAVASLRAQTFDAWELVLWDDGSTDDTLSIAHGCAATDARIRVFESEPRGRRDALIAAHANARGSYLAWLDADDWLAPTALERCLAALVEARCDMVYTQHIVVDEAGAERGIGRRAQLPYSTHGLLLDFMTFHLRLFTRDVFERAGGIDPQLEIAIDYDLCLRISEHGEIRPLAEPLYFYRQHGSQLSSRHRAGQIAASEHAIRAALHRRGLARYELTVDGETSRFRLRARVLPKELSVARWIRTAVATLVPRVRQAPVARVEVIAMWPAARDRLHLVSALDARRIHTLVIVGPLSALMRAVWSGRAGDALLVGDLAPLFDAAERGTALANCRLFILTIDHARARGMRVMWTRGAPGAITFPDEEGWCRRALAARCDAVVARPVPADEAGWRSVVMAWA